MRVWYLMWYLADTAAVSGDETSCFIADISHCKRSVIDAHVLSTAVGESKTEAGRGRPIPLDHRLADTHLPLHSELNLEGLAEMQGLFC